MSRRFEYSQTRFDEKDFPRLVTATRDAIEKPDFDSAWIQAPSSGKVEHDLGGLPSEAWGTQSDSEDGDPWIPMALTSVGSREISFTATKAFVRIIAER